MTSNRYGFIQTNQPEGCQPQNNQNNQGDASQEGQAEHSTNSYPELEELKLKFQLNYSPKSGSSYPPDPED